MDLTRTFFRFAAVPLIAFGLSANVMAGTSSVTQQVTQGELTAWVHGDALNTIAYSHGSQDSFRELTLHVDDLRGTYEGWSVTVKSSDFFYQGPASGNHDIPAANFVLGATRMPIWVSGQALDAGIAGAAINGPLDIEQTPLTAKSGHGSGNYTQVLPVTLTVPEGSPVGMYVATLTVHTSAAPN